MFFLPQRDYPLTPKGWAPTAIGKVTTQPFTCSCGRVFLVSAAIHPDTQFNKTGESELKRGKRMCPSCKASTGFVLGERKQPGARPWIEQHDSTEGSASVD